MTSEVGTSISDLISDLVRLTLELEIAARGIPVTSEARRAAADGESDGDDREEAEDGAGPRACEGSRARRADHDERR